MTAVEERADDGRRAAALVFAGTAAVFSPALLNGFVNWDDPANILHNPWLGRFDVAGLGRLFSSTLGGHFQPLAWLSLSLDKALWGLRPFGYHLTGVLLFAAASALLFLFLRGLLGGGSDADLPAAAAAVLFAWHPLRVESVAWATERRDQLSLLFLILAAELYRRAVARDPRTPRLDAALVAFAAALLTKVFSVVFPVLLLALDLGALRRPVGHKRLLEEKLSFFIVAACGLSLTVRAQFLSGAAAAAVPGTWQDRLGVFAWTPGWTVWKTAFPRGLTAFVSTGQSPSLFAAMTALTVLLWAAVAYALLRRRAGPAALGVAFFAALSPSLGLFRSGNQLSADRFTLVPAVVLSVGAAFGLARLGRRAGLGALVLAAALGALAARQTLSWRDSATLWTRAVELDLSPLSAMNAVEALSSAGRTAEAETVKARVQAELPDSGLAIGYAAERAVSRGGDWVTGERLTARAVAVEPTAAVLRVQHGVALFNLGRVPEALSEFQTAVRLSPESADAWHLLGMALARRGRLEDAEEAVHRALDLDSERPDSRELLARLEAARQGRSK